MQVKLGAPATAHEVLARLGVDGADEAALAARIARTAGVDVSAPLPAGTVVDLGTDVFLSTADGAIGAGKTAGTGPAPAGAGVGKALGALGLFGVHAAHDARTGKNDLGALSSLSALQLLGLANALVDKATLDVKVPLAPGPHDIPIGDKRVRVIVPPGTTLSLRAHIGPSAHGLVVAGADLTFSKSVQIANPADLSFADKSLLGDVANALVQVKVDGVSVASDGSVTPRGSVTRPSMNLFKHVFGSGKSENALETLVVLTGKPRVATNLAQLAKGDVVKDKTAFASADLPSRFDVGALLDAVGAVAHAGTYALHVQGRAGFLDVAAGKVVIRNKDQRLTATLTGDFHVVDGGGAVDVSAQVKSSLALPVSVGFDDKGAPHAAAGALSVAVGDGCIDVGVGGALLCAVKALADRFHVALPPGVEVQIEGDALVTGSARIKASGDGGVIVENGALKAVIDAAGSRAHADLFDVTLGAGSKIEMSASGIALDGEGNLVVEGGAAAFTASVEGVAHKGALAVILDGAGASGDARIDLTSGASPTGDGAVRWSLKARPKLGVVPLPGKAAVDGEAKVVLGPDLVAWHTDSRLRVRL